MPVEIMDTPVQNFWLQQNSLVDKDTIIEQGRDVAPSSQLLFSGSLQLAKWLCYAVLEEVQSLQEQDALSP